MVLNRFGLSLTMMGNGEPLEQPDHPFFQSLGTNGRSCSTCHEPEGGMTITPERIQARFRRTQGTDPLFRLVDGSNSPLADVSTVEARRQAYSLLLERGLIRVGIGVPAGAEFELLAVDDPYGFASSTELSLFRRPPASTNLRFLSTVMWDGRETTRDPTSPTGFAPLHFDLSRQSNDATVTHAESQVFLTQQQREAIVDFEMQVHTAQIVDFNAGRLADDGAHGGPEPLLTQEFYFGINDPLGGDPTGRPFDPTVMTSFDAWGGNLGRSHRARARESIARGQELFNHNPISIVGVSGLNDDLGLPVIPGTCTTCHDTPNAGNHSVPAPLRIGTDDPEPLGGLRAAGLPVYTLRHRVTGEIKRTTDPGRALVTGKWKDVGRFKGPTLRGLAARAPYFHNGSAARIEDVIDFYDQRFEMGLSAREKSDLLHFLAAL
jgi:cytochrome c peroxidase